MERWRGEKRGWGGEMDGGEWGKIRRTEAEAGGPGGGAGGGSRYGGAG